jgi:hypothetical protein
LSSSDLIKDLLDIPTRLTGKEASELFGQGKLLKNSIIECGGAGFCLYLANEEIETLPENLTINGTLELKCPKLKELPPRLSVSEDLIIDFCPNIKTIPDDIYIGGQLHSIFQTVNNLPAGKSRHKFTIADGKAVCNSDAFLNADHRLFNLIDMPIEVRCGSDPNYDPDTLYLIFPAHLPLKHLTYIRARAVIISIPYSLTEEDLNEHLSHLNRLRVDGDLVIISNQIKKLPQDCLVEVTGKIKYRAS